MNYKTNQQQLNGFKIDYTPIEYVTPHVNIHVKELELFFLQNVFQLHGCNDCTYEYAQLRNILHTAKLDKIHYAHALMMKGQTVNEVAAILRKDKFGKNIY